MTGLIIRVTCFFKTNVLSEQESILILLLNWLLNARKVGMCEIACIYLKEKKKELLIDFALQYDCIHETYKRAKYPQL